MRLNVLSSPRATGPSQCSVPDVVTSPSGKIKSRVSRGASINGMADSVNVNVPAGSESALIERLTSRGMSAFMCVGRGGGGSGRSGPLQHSRLPSRMQTIKLNERRDVRNNRN